MNLTNGARTAEVGLHLQPLRLGRGYAVEGLTALIGWLFQEFPLSRVWGGLYPENRASAMVLERVGMTFEGHHKLSFWLDDDNTDDWVYGMTRAGWEAWRDRPRQDPDEVRLVPINPANSGAVRSLQTHHTQRSFVASVVDSFADALVPEIVDGLPAVPWLRAVEADGELVGFVMLALPDAVHDSPFLWRLLIDRMHQRRGLGSRILDLVVDECRSLDRPLAAHELGPGQGLPRAVLPGPWFRADRQAGRRHGDRGSADDPHRASPALIAKGGGRRSSPQPLSANGFLVVPCPGRASAAAPGTGLTCPTTMRP